ncbi:hypothetical protein [Arsenophonus sp.]
MSYIVLSTLTKRVPGLASQVNRRTYAAISGFFVSVTPTLRP